MQEYNGDVPKVAQELKMPPTTLYGWINPTYTPKGSNDQVKMLKKQIEQLTAERDVLKSHVLKMTMIFMPDLMK